MRPALREWQAAEQKTDLLAERCRQLEAQIASQTGAATQGESINANSARIAELESSHAQIELVLSESEKDIAVLNGQLAELRQLVARRDLEVTEQLASAAALRQSDLVALGISQVQQQRALEDHRAMIAERDALVALNADRADGLAEQLAAARFELAHGDSRQSQLTLEIERINAELAHLETEVEQRQHAYRCHTLELEIEVGNQQQGRLANAGETQALREQLDAMRNSWVWRWFAPLQDLQLPIRATKAAAMETAIRTYRRLPVSAAAKQRLKNTIFRFSGPLFSRQDSYRRWRAYQEIQPRTEGRTEIDGQGPLNPSEQPLGADNNDQTAMPAHLPTADGGWEWAEYGSTKEHIRRLKNERMARISPKPPSILDVGGESPAAVAAKIHLPPPAEQPHVSIIVPVFNNLRFTLECLWSIAVHDDQRVTYEVIVADDASTDETARICASIPNLRLLRNDSNLGFLRNCNRALAHVRGRFTLYLNNDVQVTRGWLHALADTFERFPGTGAAGPRVIYPSGHLQEAGVAFRPDGGADMIGLNDDPDAVRYSYAREVDYVSGAKPMC